MNNKHKSLIYSVAVVAGLIVTGKLVSSEVTLAIARAQNPTATAYVTSAISSKSVQDLVEKLNEFAELGADRILLEINSTGGSVMAGQQIQSTLDNLKNVDVYVPGGMAASMAAEIWMHAAERFAEKDTEILFHGASVGEGVRQPELEVIIAILQGKEVLQSDPEIDYNTAIAMATLMIGKVGRDKALKEMSELLESIAKINHAGVSNFQKVLQEAGVEMSYDQVKAKFYGDFKRDMVFSGSELADLGITKLGRPNSSKYKY